MTMKNSRFVSTEDASVWREIMRDITPGADVQQAAAALNRAIEDADEPTACKNRYREFKDYEVTPNPYQAKMMCADCPIMGTGLCLALGLAERDNAKRRTGEKIRGIYEGAAIEHYKG